MSELWFAGRRKVREGVLAGDELESGPGVSMLRGLPEGEGVGDLWGRLTDGEEEESPVGSAAPTPAALRDEGRPQGWELLSAQLCLHTGSSVPASPLPTRKRGAAQVSGSGQCLLLMPTLMGVKGIPSFPFHT